MKFATPLLLSLTVSSAALAAGQLPKTVAPVAYDIQVKPDAAALTFSGTETVTVDVKSATSTVMLNAAALAVSRVTFDGKPAPFKLDEQAQTLTVTLPRAATPGQHKMTFAWTGKINQSASGLFAIDYTNEDGSKSRMLATQFEAPDARRFAPMWDEPAFKAKFRLSAVAPKGQLAFSNMPAQSVTQADGTQLYRFGETPVMSSYLLFLGVGDMERKTVMSGNTEIGVITRRGVVDQGDYALSQAKRLLSYYNDYFGPPYPLPKLDMIAGPGSSQFFGAMENWGAIFYFENELLVDPRRTTESGRQRIYTVVAHEMAHQWFGDLVTMAWWDDLWLNEGFASWMEGKTAADLHPEWKSDAQAISTERERAMGLDATAATHPIVRHVETVEQIGAAFDGITYAKGQAVIGMMESTLGSDPFRAGIRRYMAKYKYGNTVTDQLWSELSAAAGRPVTGIAHDFTLQGGVPLVSMAGATCKAGTTSVRLTQGRFGLDAPSKQPQTWHVPLVLATLGGGETSAVVSGNERQGVTVKGCGTLVLNRGKGSYTRVMYDDAGHGAIVRDYGKLALPDRLGTLADDFALAAGGYQDLSRYLAVQDRVADDADPLEWSAVASTLGTMSGLFTATPLEAGLRARTRAILAPELARVGYEAKADESSTVTNLRETLVGALGAAGDQDVAARARRYVGALGSNPAAIPLAIRTPILATYAANATMPEWNSLLALTKSETSPVAKNRYVQLLGTARDDAVARRALDLLKSSDITPPQKASLLRAIGRGHPDMAFDFAVANRETVEGFLEESTRSGYIVGLGGASNDPAMIGKINAFAQKYLPETSRGGAERTVAQIVARKAVADRLRPAVQRWIGKPAS